MGGLAQLALKDAKKEKKSDSRLKDAIKEAWDAVKKDSFDDFSDAFESALTIAKHQDADSEEESEKGN